VCSAKYSFPLRERLLRFWVSDVGGVYETMQHIAKYSSLVYLRYTLGMSNPNVRFWFPIILAKQTAKKAVANCQNFNTGTLNQWLPWVDKPSPRGHLSHKRRMATLQINLHDIPSGIPVLDRFQFSYDVIWHLTFSLNLPTPFSRFLNTLLRYYWLPDSANLPSISKQFTAEIAKWPREVGFIEAHPQSPPITGRCTQVIANWNCP